MLDAELSTFKSTALHLVPSGKGLRPIFGKLSSATATEF
jgi:hypothetical protein